MADILHKSRDDDSHVGVFLPGRSSAVGVPVHVHTVCWSAHLDGRVDTETVVVGTAKDKLAAEGRDSHYGERGTHQVA
jgi:hypothetical protein